MGQGWGQYEYRGEIGRGAMAVVWRGWDTKLERLVAVKEPSLSMGTNPSQAAELATRFVREGRAAARLSHPGIVAILDADTLNDRPAIVMEYIEGETLGLRIGRGPMPLEDVVVILDQLLDAVGYAHGREVVHRDIKPDNVFITREGRVKLGDFGIARIQSASRLTQFGTLLGTPGYMAPEQVVGEDVDGRADLFSVGVLAYEMVTGHNPFGATDGVPHTEIMRRVVQDEPPPLQPAGGVPASLQRVIDRALEKRRERRFQTAAEFRSELRQVALPGAAAAVFAAEAPVHAAPEEPASVALEPMYPEPDTGGGVGDTADLRMGAESTSCASPSDPAVTRPRSESTRAMMMVVTVIVGLVVVALSFAVSVVVGMVLVACAVVGGIVWSLRSNRQGSPSRPTIDPEALDGGAYGEQATYRTADTGAFVRCRVRGPRDDRVVELPLPFRVGRSADAELSVLDEQVSQWHACFYANSGQVHVEDLRSSNGTRLDGVRLAGPSAVAPGQVISVGGTSIELLG